MQKARWSTFLRRSVILLFIGFASGAAAQESQRQKPEQNSQQNQYRDQAENTLRDQQQQDTPSFAGKISEKFGKYFLEDARSRASYQLVGTGDAKRFLNKKVRVTGTLDTEKNILHVVTISLIP